MQILKQVLGVDVAQKELVVTLGRLNIDLSIELYSHKVFRNTNSGIESLVKLRECIIRSLLITSKRKVLR